MIVCLVASSFGFRPCAPPNRLLPLESPKGHVTFFSLGNRSLFSPCTSLRCQKRLQVHLVNVSCVPNTTFLFRPGEHPSGAKRERILGAHVALMSSTETRGQCFLFLYFCLWLHPYLLIVSNFLIFHSRFQFLSLPALVRLFLSQILHSSPFLL